MTTAALLLPKPNALSSAALTFRSCTDAAKASQCAGGIRLLVVGGRMDLPRVNGQNGCDAADGASGSQGVADQGLRGIDGEFVRACAKDLPKSLCLNRVSDRGRRGVRVDVIDVRGCEPCVGHGQAHGRGDLFPVFARE